MQIDTVDFYYLSMPQVLDIGDGSQDVLLVRVGAGDHEGWGECEASPLVSIASLIAPMSHSACKPVEASVLGQRLDTVDDIARIAAAVKAASFDQLQADHTWSGIDIALWDLLGRRFEVPVHQLLADGPPQPKIPYASVLFGTTPQETFERAAEAAALGYRAVKFGWQGFGLGTIDDDRDQLAAARDGLGDEVDLLVDAAMAWGDDADLAGLRAGMLADQRVVFIEEPFRPGADPAYRDLKQRLGPVRLAGGEGCHTPEMAIGMIDHSGLDYIQIDTGRIGGITAAHRVALYARARGVQFINHTFTSHLALSASLQPYAADQASPLCEYPLAAKPVSHDLTTTHLERDADGHIQLPDSPGLGVDINPDTIARYLVDVEITVNSRTLYRTPDVPQRQPVTA